MPTSAPNLAWRASALRCQALAERPYAARNRNALLRRARLQPAARCEPRWLQNDLPHAWRECGLILALRGRPRRACRAMEKSLAAAERQGAKYEYAQTLRAYGQLRQELGYPAPTSKWPLPKPR